MRSAVRRAFIRLMPPHSLNHALPLLTLWCVIAAATTGILHTESDRLREMAQTP